MIPVPLVEWPHIKPYGFLKQKSYIGRETIYAENYAGDWEFIMQANGICTTFFFFHLKFKRIFQCKNQIRRSFFFQYWISLRYSDWISLSQQMTEPNVEKVKGCNNTWTWQRTEEIMKYEFGTFSKSLWNLEIRGRKHCNPSKNSIIKTIRLLKRFLGYWGSFYFCEESPQITDVETERV